MIKQKVMKALKELKELLFKSFPDYIDKVILYGSQASGTAKDYSDYDILVILKKAYDWKLKNEIYDKSWEVDFKYDILTDIRLISNPELETIKGKQPFILNAIERGIVL
jgi:predicted nucleotidyltransferase